MSFSGGVRVPTGQQKKCDDLRIRSGFLFFELFERVPSVFGLVQLLFGVVDFFHLRFGLVNPGPFCASVVDLLFQVSQRRFIYIERIVRAAGA